MKVNRHGKGANKQKPQASQRGVGGRRPLPSTGPKRQSERDAYLQGSGKLLIGGIQPLTLFHRHTPTHRKNTHIEREEHTHAQTHAHTHAQHPDKVKADKVDQSHTLHKHSTQPNKAPSQSAGPLLTPCGLLEIVPGPAMPCPFGNSPAQR